MKRMKNISIKATAALLSIFTLITCLPLQAFALFDTTPSNKDPIATSTEIDNTNEGPAHATAFDAYSHTDEKASSQVESIEKYLDEYSGDFVEMENLRGESIKHFRLDDGTFLAVQYEKPIHRMNSDGEWVEINNSLCLSNAISTATSGSIGFATEDNRVRFAERTLSLGALITIHDNNYRISLSLKMQIVFKRLFQILTLQTKSDFLKPLNCCSPTTIKPVLCMRIYWKMLILDIRLFPMMSKKILL